jgi:hypothetical protein
MARVDTTGGPNGNAVAIGCGRGVMATRHKPRIAPLRGKSALSGSPGAGMGITSTR